ncbi:MAG: DUF5060 domain-containing protein, partial [Panacibacter sp.]
MKKLSMICVAVCITVFCFAQAPVFNSVTANSNSILKLDKFELNMSITAAYSNVYDYDDIAVQCIFTAPSLKKDTVDGFFMQDYILNADGSITPLGSGSFKVRYAPTETGVYSYVLSCKNTVGTTTRPAATFSSNASAAHGFIRKNTSNYLGFDDGTQYIPVGENMGWQNSNVVTNYTSWLDKLSANGGNFIRVWMSSWAFALEWKNGYNNYAGLKKYKQQNAFYLDWLLDKCKEKGVYTMLCLNNHGQVSSLVNPEWNDNPYKSTNGGPCVNTWDFFTNTTAKLDIKNRLRYIVARYGYSQNIQCWELFNEVEWTDQFDAHKTEITNWHDEMSTYLKSKDVYKHLVTTSYANDYNDPATWTLSNIDFTQTHYYNSSPNLERVLTGGVQSYLTRYGKPTMNGEFGLNTDGGGLAAMDANGVHIHNAIWGSALGGGMGSGMTWWWDNYIDPQNLYYHYKPLSTFVGLLKLKDENYKKIAATTIGGGTSDLTVSPGAGFIKAPANTFTIDASGNISPDANQLSAYLFGSSYNTQYRNPPTFNITYTVDGQFKVVTGSSAGTSPKITIYVDGVLKLNVDALVNTTYTVSITSGSHSIKVDNLGIDWVNISSYVFTNAGNPLSTYILKTADTTKAAGWILNNQYNWQYLKDHNNVPPPVVSGAVLTIPGMKNGNYDINFYSCSTGSLISNLNVTVNNSPLIISLPSVAWDMAFTAVNNTALPIQLNGFYGERNKDKNYLHIDIAQSENVKSVFIERGGAATSLATLSEANTSWASVAGKHVYIDEHPLKFKNLYRLKIEDKDGVVTYSNI